MSGELPKHPLRRPADRHEIRRVRLNKPRKNQNSVFDPSMNIQTDVDAINRGEARRQGEDWYVNRRRYQLKPDGVLFPVDGEGIYQPDRAEYQALAAYNEYGLTDAAEAYLSRAGVPEEKRVLARQLHQLREAQ